MARQIKWRLQFKSLNNTGCLVNIYEDGYTGSSADTTKTGADVPFAVETGVTELMGADVPFEYEEDDSSDLLEFIRIKTGYLRVVESEFGSLNSLMPTSIQHHFVEAFYGSERVFTGFMQCQEFDSPWVAAPRVLEFPVVSPLGLLEAINFSVPDTHELVTLGTLMHEVMCGLNPSASSTSEHPNSDYAAVITPSLSNDYEPWNFIINSTVIVPFNPDFHHYDWYREYGDPTIYPKDLWMPETYKFFIEGLCKCFGWMVHDTPDGIVFSKYDYVGDYYARLTLTGLLSFENTEFSYIQLLSPSFNQYYSNADDNADMIMVRPVKEIILNTGDRDIAKKELTTKHSVTGPSTILTRDTGWASVSLTQAGPDVDGTNIGKAIINTGGNVSYPGLFPLAYAKIDNGDRQYSIDESWVIKYSESWAQNIYNPIISAKFFGNPPRDFNGYTLLKLKVEYGDSLQNMQTSGFGDISLWMVIRCGNLYYDITANTWRSDSTTATSITISGADGKVQPRNSSLDPTADDLDGIIIDMNYNKVVGGIEVQLHPKVSSNIGDGNIIRIAEMSLNNPSTQLTPYVNSYQHYDKIRLGGNNTGTDTVELDVEMNNYEYITSEKSIGSSDGVPRGSNPTFPYMFKPLNVLTQKVKKIGNADGIEYGNKWTYWIYGWRWRMLAKNFNLRDDEYTITLARSSTIEPQQ